MLNYRHFLIGASIICLLIFLAKHYADSTYYNTPFQRQSATTHFPSPSLSHHRPIIDVLVNQKRHSILHCLATNPDVKWSSLAKILAPCIRRHLKTAPYLQSFPMGRFGEYKRFVIDPKYHLLPFDRTGCHWLTIGIGGDTKVERVFGEKYGNSCRVFGIEPDKVQSKGFEKFGTVIPKAVGVYPNKSDLVIRNNNGKGYHHETLMVVPLHELLDQYLHTRTVHFATLDIEGFEMPILKSLLFPKQLLYRQNITFCQLDIEFHNWKWKNNVHLIIQILYIVDYLPVNVEDFHGHLKITLISTKRLAQCQQIIDLGKILGVNGGKR